MCQLLRRSCFSGAVLEHSILSDLHNAKILTIAMCPTKREFLRARFSPHFAAFALPFSHRKLSSQTRKQNFHHIFEYNKKKSGLVIRSLDDVTTLAEAKNFAIIVAVFVRFDALVFVLTRDVGNFVGKSINARLAGGKDRQGKGLNGGGKRCFEELKYVIMSFAIDGAKSRPCLHVGVFSFRSNHDTKTANVYILWFHILPFFPPVPTQ